MEAVAAAVVVEGAAVGDLVVVGGELRAVEDSVVGEVVSVEEVGAAAAGALVAREEDVAVAEGTKTNCASRLFGLRYWYVPLVSVIPQLVYRAFSYRSRAFES